MAPKMNRMKKAKCKLNNEKLTLIGTYFQSDEINTVKSVLKINNMVKN